MERHNDERILKHAANALKSLRNAKKEAKRCLINPTEREDIISRIEDLERYFKPYEDELREIKETRKQQRLEIERICAENGHVGEWVEETYYVKTYIDHEPVDYPMTRWNRRCTRCGKQEVSETKPIEVIEAEKRKKISQLEEEIKKLKS